MCTTCTDTSITWPPPTACGERATAGHWLRVLRGVFLRGMLHLRVGRLAAHCKGFTGRPFNWGHSRSSTNSAPQPKRPKECPCLPCRRKRGFEEWGPDGDRPFVLSRAFFAGTQRIGAIWTGDNEGAPALLHEGGI